MDNDNLPPYGPSVEFKKINESLDSFGTKWALEPESNPEI